MRVRLIRRGSLGSTTTPTSTMSSFWSPATLARSIRVSCHLHARWRPLSALLHRRISSLHQALPSPTAPVLVLHSLVLASLTAFADTRAPGGRLYETCG